MSRFVLEILDGDQAGEVFPLGSSRVTLGRRPDNDFVVEDDKCSGHHAEIVFEEGNYVIRDLGSTNGTLLDGRRVHEIALSPFDKVQLGRVRVVFKEEGAEDPLENGLKVGRFDEAALRASRKRRGSLGVVLLVLVIVAGGGFVAWRNLGGEIRRSASQAQIDEVPGNLLTDGADNFERDGGWNLQASLAGAPFDISVGRASAHSGSSALVTRGGPDEDGAVRHFGLARLAEQLRVRSGALLRAFGYLRTTGGGRGALRLVFSSSADGTQVTAGTAPIGSDDYARVELQVRVPSGMDRLEAEVLALLPDAESRVYADDVAIVRDSAAQVPDLDLTTKNGRKLYGAGASAFVLGTEVAILRGIDPIAADPALVELAAAGLDTPSDTGLTLAVTDLDGAGFGFRFSQGASSTAEGLALHFPPDAAGVLTREAGDGAKFVPQDVEFDAMGVREMLLGSGEGRCLVRLAAPGRARGAVDSEGYRIELPGTFAFDLVTVFEDEARAALELNRQAAAARNRADYAEALDRIQEVLESNPHDLAAVGVARQMRSDILGELDRRVQELNTEGAQARFFEAMVGYRRVKDGIDRLIEAYGERHVPELSSLQQLSRDMVAGIETLERASGKQHGEKLKVLVDAFESSGQPKLATVVRDYIAKHYAELQKDEPQKEGGR